MKVKIERVETVPGSSLNSRWADPMQKVYTDNGVYIDNMPGISHGAIYWPGGDWTQLVGQTVSITVVNKSGHEWIKLS